MSEPKDLKTGLELLSKSVSPDDQHRGRELLPAGEEYYSFVLRSYFDNPFLALADDELEHVSKALNPAFGGLIAAREAAARSRAPRYSVCCMPKSGSSFVQSALQHALELPSVSITSFSTPHLSSHFGMNSREQEVDELALVSKILGARRGFIAQNHTRYSTYLGLQFQKYGLIPIVTFRNILDCIVSFDEMMLNWRATKMRWAWFSDTQFALPKSYPSLSDDARYGLLTKSFGIWLVGFYLSWKRCGEQDFVQPLVLRYEDDILDKDAFVDKMSGFVGMSDGQVERLRQYALAPNKNKSRLNVGVKGRGRQKIADVHRKFLREYASSFDELSPADLEYLL